MQKLSSLSEAAKAFLGEEKEDGFSFLDLLPRNYFDMPSAKGNKTFDVSDVTPRFVGYDLASPEGNQAVCAVCLADRILDKASAEHPSHEKLQLLLQRWHEIEEAISGKSPEKTSSEHAMPAIGGGYEGVPSGTYHRAKFPAEISQMKKELDAMLATWTEVELVNIQNIFLETRKSLGQIAGTQFIPRYISRIYMREGDEQLGEIQEKNGQPIRIGAFVAASVSPRTCFNRVVFTLGLQPGYHVLAGCGSADDHNSHLYFLRNIRMKLKDDLHRGNSRPIKRWQLLYAQTYEQALKIKQLNDEQPRNIGDATNESAVISLSQMWSSNISQVIAGKPELWTEGEALEKILGEPDRTFRHTVRGVMIRKSFMTGDYEVLLVVEKGDQKTGGDKTSKTGKPPAFGCPGGMVENQETIGRALEREVENESMTRKVTKIIACVSEYKKKKLVDAKKENIDHWFVIEGDREAGCSKNLIEVPEIKDVRWIPLSDLADFTFQNTRQGKAVWNVQTIMDRKMMYPNHAANLIKILPRVPGIILPENFRQFEKNLQKFWDENRT